MSASRISLILRINAISCLLFGSLFILNPMQTANFLGNMPSNVLFILGFLLFLNGLHLFWASMRRIYRFELIYFSAGDLLWVLATFGLIFMGLWVTSYQGIIAASLVACMVGILGALQIRVLMIQ